MKCRPFTLLSPAILKCLVELVTQSDYLTDFIFLEWFQLVFSSSATVYGWPKEVPCTEEFPLSATNPYGRTKVLHFNFIIIICWILTMISNESFSLFSLSSKKFVVISTVQILIGKLYCWDTSTQLVHIPVVILVKILVEFQTISCPLFNKWQLADALHWLFLETIIKQLTALEYVLTVFDLV